MKKNMGTADRAIRVLAAVVIGILLITGQLSGTLATVLGILAVVFLLTSALSFCPLYIPFNISTLKKSDSQ
jgi:hypothetical protein